MKQLRVLLLLVILLIYPTTIFAFTELQVTHNNMDDSYADMTVDPAGDIHLVYQRDSKIYYWYNSTSNPMGTEEYVANGIMPSIASGPTGIIHIAYLESNTLKYTYRNGASWIAPIPIRSDCDNSDIAVDNNNNAHIVGSIANGSIFYTHNASGTFSIPKEIMMADWDGFGSYWYGSWFFNPSISVDSNNSYHVVAEENYNVLDLDSNRDENTFYIRYINSQDPPSSQGKRITPSNDSRMRLGNSPLALTCGSVPHVVYDVSGEIRVRNKAGSSWNLLMQKPGRNGAIDSQFPCNTFGVAYVSGSSVSYFDNIGNTAVVSNGSAPVLSKGIDPSIFVAYPKSNGADKEIFLSSDDMKRPPLINSMPDVQIFEGIKYIGRKPSLSMGTLPVSWSLVTGPGNMTINNGTGIVTWLQPTIAGTPYAITIRATNFLGSAEASWLLTDKASTGFLPAVIFELLGH